MSINLRIPNITARDPAGQVQQMRSYLFRMVEELNYALQAIEKNAGGAAVQAINSGTSGTVQNTDPVTTFNSIKALIIKSADIVQAYQEKLEQNFSGKYVAHSTFGTFSEETNQKIEANSSEISQNFTNIQAISTTVEGLERTVIGVNAYINSGLLYYDTSGAPVYGIEVGQRSEVDGEEVFNKYARFTANKLSFYDANDNEVAFISDYKLYITNVQVTGSYRIGHLVDTAQSDGSVMTKFVRGD